MFFGTMPALVTPFTDEGELDREKLIELVDRQMEAKVDGLVPVGTTGESPTLSHEEHREVIRIVVQRAKGKVPVIAGTGSNSTQEALSLTRFAKEVGADAALMVMPYYNKPTQEGLYRHFKTVAEKVGLPIVLYNIPGRTGITMSPQTVARLAELKEIVAIKEATQNMDVASEIATLCDVTILSGDDSLTLPLMAIGGRGVISVLANLLPKDVKAMTDAALKGKFDEAQKQHLKLFPLFRAIFIETNPIPIKTAMSMLGLCGETLRLPLCPMVPENREKLRQALLIYGLDL